MAGIKRQKELARAKHERQQARRAARAERHKTTQRVIAAVVVAVLVLGGFAWYLISRPSGDELAAPAPSPSFAATASASSPASDPAQAENAALDCAPPGAARSDNLTFTKPEDTAGSSITLTTNCGDIVIALDAAAPKTIASEAFLAKQGFYDNTSCHRLTTAGIFVLQCGDPTGTGSGGPGYTVPDENLPAEGTANYPAGTVAMANAGANTGGSQFFIVYDDTTLPSGYTIWGKVTSGLDIVKEIASAGTADGGGDGAPAQPVFIQKATVQG